MEAFATLSFFGNVIQLVEVSTKLVKTAIKLSNSVSKVPDEINDAMVIRDSLASLLQGMKALGSTHSEHDRQLAHLTEGCQKVCQELLNFVSHVKGKGDSSKTGVFGVAWRAFTDAGKLNSIEKRLDQYKSQILAHIIVMLELVEIPFTLLSNISTPANAKAHTRHKQSATYTLIESLIKQQNAHAQSLQELIGKVKDNIAETIKSELSNTQSGTGGVRYFHDNRPATLSQERTILERSNCVEPRNPDVPFEAPLDFLVAARAALATVVQTSEAITVQEWLCFPELLSRESAIHDAHANTYTWLLNDGDPDENIHEDGEDDSEFRRERTRNRDAICTWLKSGSGIFYISGKAGSGKSTLMKYLARASQTREHLANWAKIDGKDLIFAEFFFWRSGTPLQRGIEGLYRGILWKILDAHSDFVPYASAAFWGDKNGAFDGRIHRPEPTLPELEAAFDILIKSPKTPSKHRICLFIDGLDEFEGDYWKLAQRLTKWCASDDVKICVSSRPRNEFSKAFNAVPGATWFSLHDLTKPDMLNFVRDTFEKDLRYAEACAENPDCPSLLYSIVDRADGVFLWVRLVLNQLLVDMGNSSSLIQLHQKLDEIPSDLKSLYDQMLRRINKLNRVKLARTFILMDTQLWLPRCEKRVREYWLNLSVYAHAVLDDIADNPDLETQLLDGSLGPYLSKSGCISKCSQMRRRLIGRCQGLLDIVETGRPFPDCHRVSFFHRSVVDFLKEPEIDSYMQELLRDFNPRRAVAHILLAKVKFLPWYKNPPKHFDHQETSPDDDEAVLKIAAEKVGKLIEDLGSLSTEKCSLFQEVNSLKRMAEKLNYGETKLWTKRFWGGVAMGSMEEIDVADLDSTVLCTVLSVDCSVELAKEIIQRSPRVLDNPKWNSLLSIWMFSRPAMDENKMYLIRLLLEGGVSPNTEVDRKVSKPWPITPWTFALWNLSSDWSLYEPHKMNFLSCIELLLFHGADPCVCFIGYKVCRSVSADGSGPEREGSTRLEPYYADLMTMMKIWGFQPTKEIRRLLLSSRLSQGPTKIGRYFRSLRRGKLHPIQLDSPDNIEFKVLCVLPRQALTQISTTDVEKLRYWEQGLLR
ncbi:hypothetical protein F4680DRAFT_467757 [Xylaria scruposa]|nr:hypothetical protein F4680DRAFT_467757 [Xylaria scruposa]